MLEERQEDVHLDDGVEETRVRNVASIDPDRTGSAPTFPARTKPLSPAAADVPPAPADVPPAPSFHAADTGYTAAADTTVHRAAQPPQEAAEPAGGHAQDRSKRNLWLAISGATVLALAVAVGLVVANAAPQTPSAPETAEVKKPPADALDNGTVPDVEGLAAAPKAEDPNIIVFSWTNPQPKEGDTFKYRAKSVKEDGPFETTTTNQAFISGFIDPPICLQVILVRADGSASPGGPDSIACLQE